MRIKVAMTIAGSDSGGGAGIEADLKTFASLGVHGTASITSITAQNTCEVRSVFDLPPNMIRDQIEVVSEDIGIDAAKTGMLHSGEVIRAVSEEVERWGFPLVVDPVMVAKSGARLMEEEAVEELKSRLIPLAAVITPNLMEAEALSGVRIEGIEGMKLAARRISDLGVNAVVIKGGHLKGRATDLFYFGGKFELLDAERLDVRTTHGTGCSFSAAIAACLAKGMGVRESVRVAKEFITEAIRFGIEVGRGHGPVNPMAPLYKEANRFKVIESLSRAIELLEGCEEVVEMIPEVQSNVVMATIYPSGLGDVAGIEGRLVRLKRGVKASSCPSFGVSRHVASAVLVANRHDPRVRAGMNVKYSKELVRLMESEGLSVSGYDRSREPKEVKEVEGRSTPWGTEEAIRALGRVPDAIYHTGDWGKEPMVILLGRDAVEVTERVIRLARKLKSVVDEPPSVP